jgi:hypothetical protein
MALLLKSNPQEPFGVERGDPPRDGRARATGKSA